MLGTPGDALLSSILQHILSCLPSQRPASKFSGLNITGIYHHQLIDYTSVTIPKSKLILRNQKRVMVENRNCSVRAKHPGLDRVKDVVCGHPGFSVKVSLVQRGKYHRESDSNQQ